MALDILFIILIYNNINIKSAACWCGWQGRNSMAFWWLEWLYTFQYTTRAAWNDHKQL